MESFKKVLGKVDSKKQMAIPIDFVNHLPPHQGGYTIYFPVMDNSGEIWKFGYYIRGGEDHPKPVFQGDWHKYVTTKKLVAGDQIIFRRHDDGHYTIVAQKRINMKLFGKVITWAPEF